MGGFIEALEHFAAKAGVNLPATKPGTGGKFVEEVYDYRDADDSLIYQAIRYRKHDGGKTFRQRRPDGQGGFAYNLDGVSPLPFRLPELLAADPSQTVWVVEGEKDVNRAISEGLVATCNHGGTGNTRAWAELAPSFRGRDVVVIADNDDPGRKHAAGVADHFVAHAASVRVIDLFDVPHRGDLSDFLDRGHEVEELVHLAQQAPLHSKTEGQVPDVIEEGGFRGFLANPPEPQAIRDQLLPVEPLIPEMIPSPFRPWVADISERMQCPLEFLAVGLMVVVGSLVGRRMTLRPKRRDEWTVIPNLWGGVVGNPGVMKTPALAEVMKPLRRLEQESRLRYEEEQQRFELDRLLAASRAEEAEREIKSKLKEGGTDEERLRDLAAQAVAAQQIDRPARNDTSSTTRRSRNWERFSRTIPTACSSSATN